MTWNIIGHDWATTLLQRDLAQQRLRHAYLFTGPQGIGKRTMVNAFTQALLCTHANAPCGECRNCQRATKETHPDLFTIAPIISGKRVRTEKIKVEPIRQLIYDLTLKPVESNRRVARLLRFEAANNETMNAFLKTLEEPPDNVIILITAESADDLLPTIVSRCELLALRPLSLATVQEALITRWLASAEQAELLAHLSGGRLGWAVRMLEDKEALETRSQKLSDLRTLLSATRVQRFAYAEKWSRESTDKIQDTLDLWLSFWRDVLLTSAETENPLTNLDVGGDIRRLAQALSPITVREIIVGTRRTAELLERNINARLALETLLLDWPQV